MSEVYPDATIELLVCEHTDLAGNRCMAAPIGSVRHRATGSGYPDIEWGPFCEEHLRIEYERVVHGAERMVWCEAETSKGLACSNVPTFELDGKLYCYTHYRKAIVSKVDGE